MRREQEGQTETGRFTPCVARGKELIVPNPKLKVLEQVKEVMRLKHYSIRTQISYCAWIKRYIKFHG